MVYRLLVDDENKRQESNSITYILLCTGLPGDCPFTVPSLFHVSQILTLSPEVIFPTGILFCPYLGRETDRLLSLSFFTSSLIHNLFSASLRVLCASGTCQAPTATKCRSVRSLWSRLSARAGQNDLHRRPSPHRDTLTPHGETFFDPQPDPHGKSNRKTQWK